MGFFDFLGAKETSPRGVYSIQAEFHPYSLRPNTDDFVELEINLQNISQEKELTSVRLEVPKGIGFVRSALKQDHEVRLGVLEPSEKKFLKIQIWGTSRTEKGTYAIDVYVVAHHQDYSHVKNHSHKKLSIRVE